MTKVIIDHTLSANSSEYIKRQTLSINECNHNIALARMKPLRDAGLAVGKSYLIQSRIGRMVLATVLDFTNHGEYPRVHVQMLNKRDSHRGEPLGAPRNLDPKNWYTIEEVEIGN